MRHTPQSVSMILSKGKSSKSYEWMSEGRSTVPCAMQDVPTRPVKSVAIKRAAIEFFSPALTPPPLIQLISIVPLTALTQLLSSKHVAYCPSRERKKNSSRERSRYGVRLKIEEDTIHATQRSTKESTRVESSATRNSALLFDVMQCA